MSTFTLWVFDTDDSRVEELGKAMRDSKVVKAVCANGTEVKEKVGVDALWVTPTQAASWHRSDTKRIYESEVVRTPPEEQRKGFPAYMIVGMYLPPQHRFTHEEELDLIAQALVGSVGQLRVICKKESPTVATIPENILLDKLPAHVVIDAIESAARADSSRP